MPAPSAVSPASAEELVIQLFKNAGWDVRTHAQQGAPQAELEVSLGEVAFAVEVVSVPRGSSVPLEQPWSMASLLSQAGANNLRRPLAIVVAPTVSESAVPRLMAFRLRYAPDIAMGVIDSRGYRWFSDSALEALNAAPDFEQNKRISKPPPAQNLFSDLNQWLLKVLLAPEIALPLLAAPRDQCRNATELARNGKCSVMSAHRFIQELLREGFLHENSRYLRIVRREQLFDRWMSAKSHVHTALPFRMAIKRDLRQKLGHYFPLSRACLGLFAAADELDVGFVSGVPPHVLVDRAAVLPNAHESLPGASELISAGDGEPADVIVRIPKAVKSVMRGVVKPKGARCSDIIQTWLDVSSHGSRGAEQADVIWNAHIKKLVASE